MPNNDQDLSFSFDPSSIIQAYDRVNKSRAAFEKGTVDGAKKLDSALRNFAESATKFTDRAAQSQERQIRSLERMASVAGKSGVDRLITDRDRLIKRLGTEESAVNRITAAYSKLIAEEKKRGGGSSGGGGSHGFSSNPALVLRGVRDVFEGRIAYGEVMLGRAAVGFSAIAPVLTGITTGFLALGAAAIKSYTDLAKFGVETSATAVRLGVTTKQVTQLSYAAEATGQDVNIFERMMRGLTQAVEDQSSAGDKSRSWLTRFGVDIRGVRDGTVGTYEVMLQLAQGVASIQNPLERTKAELDLFKRVGIESAPVLMDLVRLSKEARDAGFGQDDASIANFKKYNENITFLKTELHEVRIEIEKIFASGIDKLVRVGSFIKAKVPPVMPVPGGQGLDLGLTGYSVNGMPTLSPNYLARARDAAAIKSYQSSLGPEFRLKEAEKALGKTSEIDQYSNADDVKQRQQAEALVTLRREEVRLSERLKSNEEDIRKIRIETAELLSRPYGLLGADKQLLEFSKREGATSAQVESLRAVLAPLRKQQVDLAIRTGTARANEDLTFGKESPLSPEGIIQRDANRAAAAARGYSRGLERTGRRLSIDDRLGEETRRAIDRADETAGRIGVTLAGSPEARLAAETRIAQVKVDAANRDFNIAQEKYRYSEDREQELALLRIQHEQEISTIRSDLQEKAAQEFRAQLDSIKSASADLFTTFFTNPSSFGSKLTGTLRDATLKPLAEGFGERVSGILQPTIFGRTGTGGIAGTLRSVFGGGIGTGVGMESVRLVNGAVPVVVVGGSGTSGGSNYRATVSQPLAGLAMLAMLGGIAQTGLGGYSSVPSSGPAGVVSSSIDFGGGAIPLGGTNYGGLDTLSSVIGGPGGTSGFSGRIPGFGGRTAGGRFGGLRNLVNLGGLKDLFFNSGSISLGGGNATTAAGIGGVGGKLAGVASSPAAGIGGLFLAQQSLLGSWAGSKKGLLGGTAGGALAGFSLGGPLGAAIGAGVGFGIGLGEMIAGVEPKWKQAQRLVRETYHISVNRQVGEQIASVAQSSYGGQVSIAVRSPEVREMLGLYTAGTGQASSFPQSSLSPRGGGLTQSGGRLFQSPSYQYGNAYAYQSSLPVYGGSADTLPSPGSSGPTYLSLNVSGAHLARFITGEFITPEFVQSQNDSAIRANVGRVQTALNLNDAGAIVS